MEQVKFDAELTAQKEAFNRNALILNSYYKNFNPWAAFGKFKKQGVPIDHICTTMKILAEKKPPAPYPFAVLCFKNLGVQDNILQSLQEHEENKKQLNKGIPVMKEIFKGMFS